MLGGKSRADYNTYIRISQVDNHEEIQMMHEDEEMDEDGENDDDKSKMMGMMMEMMMKHMNVGSKSDKNVGMRSPDDELDKFFDKNAENEEEKGVKKKKSKAKMK